MRAAKAIKSESRQLEESLGVDELAQIIDRETGLKECVEALEKIAKPYEWPKTGHGALCVGCGEWTPARHPEAHDHADECPEVARVEEINNKRALALKILERWK